MAACAAPFVRQRRPTVKQIVITTDELSKCTALAEILEAIFPECEVRVVVGETAVHGKTSGGLPSSIQTH